MSSVPALRHGDFRLIDLRLPDRVVRDCARGGLHSVADVLATADRPDVVPAESWTAAAAAVERFVAVPLPFTAVVPLDQRLDEVVTVSRALRGFRVVGAETVGQFLACPREELLAVRDFGARTWERALEAVRELAQRAAESCDLDWLPAALLDQRVADLRVPELVRDQLLASAARTVRDLLLGLGPDDADARQAVRDALAHAAAAGRGRDAPDRETFPAMLRRVRSNLEDTDRRLLDAILGLGRRAMAPIRAVIALRLPLQEADRRISPLRATIREAAGTALERLASDLRAEFNVHEGLAGLEDLAVGTELHAATQQSPDPALPLRLLAFCFPERCCFEADRLCNATADDLRALVRTLRAALRTARPPVRLADLAEAAREVEAGRHPGIVLHVLRRILGLSITLHPDSGEIVTRRRSSIASRIETILEDADGPLGIDDLLFRYRDRHGRGSRRRIADALRAGSAFLEVGPEVWSLHHRHVDEMELLRPEGERLAEEIVQTGRRISLRERVRRGEISDRSAYLLGAILSREPALRNLGRGEFVARRAGTSSLVAELVAEFRRAMGEVPFSRFLQNQPVGRRRLVSHLLRRNRLFVSPSKDRMDLIENYPFNPDRIRMLLRVVSIRVNESGGYAPIASIRLAIDAAELGGSFLTDHLLLDILRRHGEFEILPGPWIAAPDICLGRWIQRTARDILRSQVTALTPEQILAERPELAEFADSLSELLEQDPLVQSEDGLHYQVV